MLSLILLASSSSSTPFHFSNTLGSHMVLQRDRPAPIWGWATPGANVTVTLDGKPASPPTSATATENGLWRVVLPAQPATLTGRTITAVVSSGETIALTDVLFGEVVLCSGQSNMELVLPVVVNATAEIEAADNYPHIRLFTGPMQNADSLKNGENEPQIFNVTHDELYWIRMNWSVASAKGVRECVWLYIIFIRVYD